MVETDRIRISKEFQEKLYDFKARCYANGKVPPSMPQITKIISKYIDIQKIFQNETDKI